MRQQPTMLLVDDDRTFVADVTPLLTQSGYTVVAAAQAETALDYLRCQPADIVVSDVHMPPGITGHELLRHLRAEHNNIPVILMSSQPVYESTDTTRPVADDYLTKPFGIDDLVARVDAVLARHKREMTARTPYAIIDQPPSRDRIGIGRGAKTMNKTLIWAAPLILGIVVAIVFQLIPGIFPDPGHVVVNASYLAIGLGIALSLVMLGAIALQNRRELGWSEENRQLQADAEKRIVEAHASADSHASSTQADLQQQLADLQQQLAEVHAHEEQTRLDSTGQTAELADQVTEAARQVEQKATKARHDFYKRLDHEVKQPLQRLQSAADNLYRSAGVTQGEPKNYYGRITNEIKQVNSLVEDLRNLAEISSDKQPFAPERLSLSELLSEIVGDVKANDLRATTRDIQLNLPDFPELPPPDILGEPYNLTRVFRNLLDNAIKYTEENGKIRVRVYASQERDQVIVEVIDNGRGIPANELEQVWEELYRASNAGFDGRGMGLALVRIVVERHGARRSIRRLDPPQSGTKVTLSFPAISATTGAYQPTIQVADQPLAHQTMAAPASAMGVPPAPPLAGAVGDTPRSH